MNYQIIKIGWSHHHAPVEYRAQLAFQNREIQQFIHLVGENPKIAELVALSTCNRIEFYALAESSVHVLCAIKNLYVNILKRNILWGQSDPVIYSGMEVIQHLCRVAAGMDSLVLGENQILSQVKVARQTLIQNHPDADVLIKLFNNAVHCVEVMHKDAISFSGPTSISELAVKTVLQRFDNIEQLKVLILGAGETAQLTARYFKRSGIKQIIIANRNEKRGRALAESIFANFIKMQNINDILYKYDIIVTATHSRDFLIKRIQIKNIMTRRKDLLVLLDISLPRNIDPTICDIDNVLLYDLDHLDAMDAKNRRKNKEALAKAEIIIQHHSLKIMDWFKLRYLKESKLEFTEERV